MSKDKNTPVTLSVGGKEIKSSIQGMREIVNSFKDDKSKEYFQISKVKFDGKEVKINYSKRIKDDEHVDCQFVCKDLPHSDFENALEKIKNDFMDILELPEEYGADLELRGLSIKLDDFLSKEGVTITGLKKLNSGKQVCINTPYLEFSDENSVLTERTIKKINHLEDEAFKYIDGKRKNAQLKLVVNS